MLLALLAAAGAAGAAPIDREAVVRRHPVRLRGIGQAVGGEAAASAVLQGQPLTLTVGNGAIGFNADATGLQSLNATYGTFPLSTLSDWGWHSAPPPGVPAGPGHQAAVDAFFASYEYDEYEISTGRVVPYPTAAAPSFTPGQRTGASPFEWLRANPHRLDLIQVALRRAAAPHVPLAPADLHTAAQELSPWTGALSSNFSMSGGDVRTRTACHMDLDILSWQLDSKLLATKSSGSDALVLRVAFPYGAGAMGGAGHNWTADAAHSTTVVHSTPTSMLLRRRLDFDEVEVLCRWSSGLSLERDGPHAFLLRSESAMTAELSCLLAPPDANYPIDPGSAWLTKKAAATRALLSGSTELPLFAEVAANAAAGWQKFWSSGAFVDLADAASGRFADPRAEELERRVVLSQYLTRSQSAGSTPRKNSSAHAVD